MSAQSYRVSLAKRLSALARSAAISAGKRIPYVHTASRAARDAASRLSYRRLCARTPIEARTIVFECYSGRSYACSPAALCEAILADPAYANHTLIWVLQPGIAAALAARGGYRVLGLDDSSAALAAHVGLDRAFSAEALSALTRVTVVAAGSAEYSHSYARAGLWIVNCRIPAHLMPRTGQRLLQAWHGTPLKRLGYDIDSSATGNKMYRPRDWHHFYGLEARRLTWLLSPSPFATTALTSAFNLAKFGKADAVIEEGYPRNDFLSTFTPQHAQRIRARLGIPEGKRVVLYAPTWRDNEHRSDTGYTFESPLDMDELRAELGEGYVILFRTHYLIANSFDFARHDGFVIDVSRVNDINELYCVSDILVTDYSSVFFDFANLARPMVFFLYDLERYAEEVRGFYLPIECVPGPIARTHKQLVEEIRRTDVDDNRATSRLHEFTHEYAPKDDGKAGVRVLARVLEDPV
jgi:CDP-glycerol glycerophosphotransferase